jgi:hypothetical protein
MDSDSQDILKIITKGMILLGIKGERLPSEFELKYMSKMIKVDYGNLPIGEFDLAFELCAKNKLDEVAETFQNFSVIYLSRMMCSYARWVRLNYVSEPIPETKKIEAPKVSDDEILQTSFEIYKRNKDWEHIFNGLRCFNILYKREIITDFEGTLERTENAIREKFRYANHKEKKQMKEILEDDEQMELNCRRMAVAEYFKTLM